MKRIVSILVSIILIFNICESAFASTNHFNTDSYAPPDLVEDYLGELGKDTDCAIDLAKKTVEEYIQINMRKYDPAAKDTLSYDHVIRTDNAFKDYAEKQMLLTNNRYRSFDSLRLERVNYKIEYGDIRLNKGLFTIHVSVLEQKKYENQTECGYVLTNHVITVEQVNGNFYIKNDVTDDYVDAYLRNCSVEDNCTIDDLIQEDKAVIRDTLNKSEEEMTAYLQSREMKLTSHIEINCVEDFSEASNFMDDSDNDYVRDSETVIDEEAHIYSLNKGIKIYGFNFGAMVSYAAKYNGASPKKKSNYNPAYEYYPLPMGGDCTNYVSQILYAGGAPMDEQGSYQWYYKSPTNRCRWTSVTELYDYLIHNDYIGPQGKDITNSGSFYAASRGDLVQVKFLGAKSYGHSLWIISHEIGTTSRTRIASHTNDRWNEPLESISGAKRWIKLTGYGKL